MKVIIMRGCAPQTKFFSLFCCNFVYFESIGEKICMLGKKYAYFLPIGEKICISPPFSSPFNKICISPPFSSPFNHFFPPCYLAIFFYCKLSIQVIIYKKVIFLLFLEIIKMWSVEV